MHHSLYDRDASVDQRYMSDVSVLSRRHQRNRPARNRPATSDGCDSGCGTAAAVSDDVMAVDEGEVETESDETSTRERDVSGEETTPTVTRPYLDNDDSTTDLHGQPTFSHSFTFVLLPSHE